MKSAGFFMCARQDAFTRSETLLFFSQTSGLELFSHAMGNRDHEVLRKCRMGL